MPLNAPNLKVDIYLNDQCDSLFLEDETGLYSVDNVGGYGLPGGLTVNSVATVTVTLTYTQLSTTLVYVFTVSNGTITAATSSLASASPVNILSQLVSTVWPFTSDNPFELTKDYGVTLPVLEDAAYTLDYEVVGTQSGTPYDYSTDDSVLVSCAACCCISEALVTQDINKVSDVTLNGAMRADAYLKIAQFALDADDISKANQFLIRAQQLCDCNCGC